MVVKRLIALSLAALLISFVPIASADDNLQSANVLTEGVSSSGYVCYEDECTPNDEVDWWKVYAYSGDIVEISFSGSIPNPAWWCPGDGWEADYSIHDSSGGQVASLSLNDDNPTGTLSKTMSTADWVYVKIKGKDSWCNDAVQYTLTASIDSGDRDTDEDGFIDSEDDCDITPGTSIYDRKGCIDTDSDGYSNPEIGWSTNNGADAFENEASQWQDSDNDGYGDNVDGYQGDFCPYKRGYSFSDRFGCLDNDGDGYSDADPGGLDGITEWFAHPLGLGDAFPYDSTQWTDTDDDGFGDNWEDSDWNQTHQAWGIGQWLVNATDPDACPFITGYSSSDRFGCSDSDGDSYSDGDLNWTVENGSDAFPSEPSQWNDRDYDGWGDNQTFGALFIDDFPDNPTQWRDTDQDGWGDNRTYGASQIDDFPFIPSQYRDTDADGYGDNILGFEGDICISSTPEEVESGWISIFDRLGCRDVDMDGFSNPTTDWIAHPDGFADAFPEERSQWHDTDSDGFGDNMEYFDGQTWRESFRGDGCTTTIGLSTFDRWGCPDTDLDGWSDSTTSWLASPGGSGDAWPEDTTQWHDRDGDGRGDNPQGTTADVCSDDAGTSVGPAEGGDRWGCIDTDGDGWSDLGDSFIHEPTQWRDTDGDGYGDSITGNQGDSCPKLRGTSILDRLGCRDTDGDGWSDPTDTWQAHPFGLADSFPNEALQWRDSDGDGFGDVALGSMRDDCPLSAGDSIRDLQGCPDANNDGWSDDYGGLKSAIAILGEDPAASWLTYLVIGLGFISGALLALLVKKSRDDDDLTGDEIFETKQHVDFEQLTENTFPVDGMIPLEQLPPLPELSLPMPTIDNQPIVASETVEGGEYNA
jgi:hypothetical protein